PAQRIKFGCPVLGSTTTFLLERDTLGIIRRFREDIQAAKDRDPAARSTFEVAAGYTGLHAIWMHRLAHKMWDKEPLKTPARLLSQLNRALTGIETHPGADIGRRFFIDHGMGVVIGETTEIANHVMLYHAATLGGESLVRRRRPPALEDAVVGGAGAKIRGPVVIGARTAAGANAVVVKDPPEDSSATGIPAQVRHRRGSEEAKPAVDPPEYVDPAMWI